MFCENKPRTVIGIIIKVIIGLFIAAFMGLIMGLFVKILWNWLMPEIFGVAAITFWQAWGIMMLSHILFKSFPHPAPPYARYHYFKHKMRTRDELRRRFTHPQCHTDVAEPVDESDHI